MSWQLATVLVGGIGTLAVYTFLIKENSFYRFFEHLFIGIASGFGLVYTLRSTIWPQVIVPLLGLDIVRYPDGTLSAPYNYNYLLLIVPISIGLLYYAIYSERYSWLAKIVIGINLGVSSTLYLKGFFNEMMPQIIKSFRPLLVFDTTEQGRHWNVWSSFENTIFVVTLLSVMYYFFFSFKHTQGKIGARVSKIGRWLMMICFGAFFGSTVMARLALLVERLQFLSGPWWQALKGLVVAG